MFQEIFNKNLKNSKLTVDELSKKLAIKKTFLIMFLEGEAEPNLRELKALCTELKISKDDFEKLSNSKISRKIFNIDLYNMMIFYILLLSVFLGLVFETVLVPIVFCLIISYIFYIIKNYDVDKTFGKRKNKRTISDYLCSFLPRNTLNVAQTNDAKKERKTVYRYLSLIFTGFFILMFIIIIFNLNYEIAWYLILPMIACYFISYLVDFIFFERAAKRAYKQLLNLKKELYK